MFTLYALCQRQCKLAAETDQTEASEPLPISVFGLQFDVKQ